jgi:signal transduction histidine kinase
MPSSPKNRQQTELLRALRALRWPLAGVVGLIFVLVRIVESTALDEWPRDDRLPLIAVLDPIFWGGLAAVAIWMVLSWAANQEQRYRAAEAQMMTELRKSNAQLTLLYEINQRIASSATVDEILDYAVGLPARLIGARAVVLVLRDARDMPLTMRCVGIDTAALVSLRSSFDRGTRPDAPGSPYVLLSRRKVASSLNACIIMPLVEAGPQNHNGKRALGWIEAYLETGQSKGRSNDIQIDASGQPTLIENTQELLITVAGELTEALVGARRRSRELASAAALETAITEERTRIARDLHDGIAQSLAFMRMRADLWEDWLEQNPEQLRQEFAGFKANLRTQIEELRRAIFALRPIELGRLGFEGALRRFVTDFADQHGWDLALELSKLPHALPHALELAAFRVVQEALNNIAKHANASHVAVMLGLVDGGLQIIVRDDGIGFNPGTLSDQGGAHLGLRQMRERAVALDGHLTLISHPNEGTELRVWLPIFFAQASLETSAVNHSVSRT